MEPSPQIIEGLSAEGCASALIRQQVCCDHANATTTYPPTHASGPTTACATLQPSVLQLLHGFRALVHEPCACHLVAGVGGGAAAEPKGNTYHDLARMSRTSPDPRAPASTPHPLTARPHELVRWIPTITHARPLLTL